MLAGEVELFFFVSLSFPGEFISFRLLFLPLSTQQLSSNSKLYISLTSYVSAACLVTSPLRSSAPTPSSAVRLLARGTRLRTRRWWVLSFARPTMPPRKRRCWVSPLL